MKDLVEALSAFPKLQTIESYQSDRNRPAWICFYYGNSICELSDFALGYLGKELMEGLGEGTCLSINVKTYGLPQGELSIRPRVMSKLVSMLLDDNSKPSGSREI